jgi:hypothetical protein
MQEMINIIKTIIITIIIVGMFIASFYVGYVLIIFGFLLLVIIIVYSIISNLGSDSDDYEPREYDRYDDIFNGKY